MFDVRPSSVVYPQQGGQALVVSFGRLLRKIPFKTVKSIKESKRSLRLCLIFVTREITKHSRPQELSSKLYTVTIFSKRPKVPILWSKEAGIPSEGEDCATFGIFMPIVRHLFSLGMTTLDVQPPTKLF